MIVEKLYTIAPGVCDQKGRLSPKGILDLLNLIAGIHAESIGHGSMETPAADIAWMVLNWKVCITRVPALGDRVILRTWSSGYERLQATREVEIEDSVGEIIIKATSVWVAVDPQKGSLMRLTPEIMDRYESETGIFCFPGFRFPRYGKVDMPVSLEKIYTITEDMIDVNHHVHNSDYLTLALEVLPCKEDESALFDFEITFKKEILPGASVRIQYAEPGEDGEYVIIRALEDQTLHTVMKIRRCS